MNRHIKNILKARHQNEHQKIYNMNACSEVAVPIKCECNKCECARIATVMQLDDNDRYASPENKDEARFWQWTFRCTECGFTEHKDVPTFYYVPLYDLKTLKDAFFWITHIDGAKANGAWLTGWLWAMDKLFPGATNPLDSFPPKRWTPCEVHQKAHEPQPKVEKTHSASYYAESEPKRA